ncbi:MAG: hypothetical protein LBE48_00130 [Methanomassiliicoccaceae archaeon]|jgi:hypothetical protein|nr:hypothetical protein [Methanomassiliicoccaceae archaeon]
MTADSLHFKGEFLMKFLSKELLRARDEAFASALRRDVANDAGNKIYSKYRIEPIVLFENGIQKSEAAGYMVDPYIKRNSPDENFHKIACNVTEYRIPFEGDERLFRYTTNPYPFYPYGRLEGEMFVISVREGDETYLSDYDYNLNLLRSCVERVSKAVRCYNTDLRETMIYFSRELLSCESKEYIDANDHEYYL